jgi:DNA-binding transcriptional regulator YhcF (GntR family)
MRRATRDILLIKIDLAAAVPADRQIVDAIRTLLVGGALSAGQKLPTVRHLALDLGIHHNTVAEAYRILADEGWLALGRRRGATVLARKPPTQNVEVQKRFARRLRELVAEVRAAGLTSERVRLELAACEEDFAKRS